jgi:hypothetical protein
MSLLEIFNKVSEHLLTQNKKAFDNNHGRCCYQIKDDLSNRNLKCAAGCLISDQDYSPDMEGYPIHLKNDPDFESDTLINIYFHEKYSEEEIKLIVELQKLHDFNDPDLWKSGLNIIKNEIQSE